MQVAQDINVGVRFSRGGFEYTLQGVDIAELIEWSQKLIERMRRLPELTNVSSDLLANSPQLKVTINRDQASRFGISAQLIDDTLYDAYGQRQVTQYYTQLNSSPVILEIARHRRRRTANRAGGHRFEQDWTSHRHTPRPVSSCYSGVQSPTQYCARPSRGCHLPSRERHRDAGLNHRNLP